MLFVRKNLLKYGHNVNSVIVQFSERLPDNISVPWKRRASGYRSVRPGTEMNLQKIRGEGYARGTEDTVRMCKGGGITAETEKKEKKGNLVFQTDCHNFSVGFAFCCRG